MKRPGFFGVKIAHHRILAAVLSVQGVKRIAWIATVIGARMIEPQGMPDLVDQRHELIAAIREVREISARGIQVNVAINT